MLPEVAMPDTPGEPNIPLSRPSQCSTRKSPPPMEDRAIRFVLPPPKFAPPISSQWPDEEPAWSDFMVRSVFALLFMLQSLINLISVISR